MTEFLMLTGLWLGSMILAPVVASEKGHGGGMWFLAALFFGPLALLGAAGMPDRRAERAEQKGNEAEPFGPTGD
jgi:hypothetical protein